MKLLAYRKQHVPTLDDYLKEFSNEVFLNANNQKAFTWPFRLYLYTELFHKL